MCPFSLYSFSSSVYLSRGVFSVCKQLPSLNYIYISLRFSSNMLGDRGALAVVTLIFFVLAFVAALFVCLKHGFGRNGGWVFLMIFSIIRVAGSIAELVAVNDPSISSITAAAVLASSGFSTLLMAQIGFLQRL